MDDQGYRVSWSFTIPGQPPSVNKSYRITQQDGLKKDGSPYTYRTLSKRKEVLDYQAVAAMVCRTAKPRGWKPAGFVVVEMELFMVRHVDADNTIKAIFDSIEAATGVNDKWYLPCVKSAQVGFKPQTACVKVTIREA